MRETIIFLLSSASEILKMDQDDYAKLVSGANTTSRYAGQTMRLADWYVQVAAPQPIEIKNENYSLLHFDAEGRVIHPSTEGLADAYCPQSGEMESFPEGEGMRGSNVEFPWYPTEEERRRMLEMIS